MTLRGGLRPRPAMRVVASRAAARRATRGRGPTDGRLDRVGGTPYKRLYTEAVVSRARSAAPLGMTRT